jgi:hypothetical protein
MGGALVATSLGGILLPILKKELYMEKDFINLVCAILFISNFACAGFCSHVAIAKNLNGIKWGFGGLFFGIIALIAIAGMPEKKSY